MTLAGDAASCSHLGGVLRSAAARLLTTRPETGRVPGMDVLVDELDRVGTGLQGYAQELGELRRLLRELQVDVEAAGLELDLLRVVEPYGVSSADHASYRRAAVPELQLRADRIATRVGRARAALRRTAAHAEQALRRSG